MKITFSTRNKVLEVVSFALLVGMIAYTAASWASVPEILPTHFDWQGVADRYGSKNEFLAVMLIPIAIFGVITLLEFFPKVWNMPVERESAAYPHVVELTHTLLLLTKIFLIVVFGSIMLGALQGRTLPIWLLPVLLAALAVIIIGYALAVKRARREWENDQTR